MFHALRSADDAGINGAGIAARGHDFVAFLDDALHSFAGFSTGLFAQRLKYLF